MSIEDTQNTARQILDLSRPLVEGPNTYGSNPIFASVLEGVFRRDVMTLDTVLHLSELEKEKYMVSGSSCVDLSRAVLEDLVGIAYMSMKGKEVFAKRFKDSQAVEAKKILDIYESAGWPLDKSLRSDVDRAIKGDSKEFFNEDGSIKLHSWYNKGVRGMIKELISQGELKKWEQNTLLLIYVLGNQKNHLSPMSIQNYMYGDLFESVGQNEMWQGLSFITIAIVRMSIMLIDEVEDRPKVKKDEIRAVWKSLNEATNKF